LALCNIGTQYIYLFSFVTTTNKSSKHVNLDDHCDHQTHNQKTCPPTSNNNKTKSQPTCKLKIKSNQRNKLEENVLFWYVHKFDISLLLWFTTNITTQAFSRTHAPITTIWQNHLKVSVLNEGIVYSLAMCHIRVCKKNMKILYSFCHYIT
jgi:hypothetical protein